MTRDVVVWVEHRNQEVESITYQMLAAGRELAHAVQELGLGLAATWDRALLRGPRAVQAIEPTGPQVAIVELRNGERLSIRVSGRRSVNRFWLSLPVRMSARRRLLVTADMLEPEEFRALRLWAIWGKVPPGVAAAPPAACDPSGHEPNYFPGVLSVAKRQENRESGRGGATGGRGGRQGGGPGSAPGAAPAAAVGVRGQGAAGRGGAATVCRRPVGDRPELFPRRRVCGK